MVGREKLLFVEFCKPANPKIIGNKTIYLYYRWHNMTKR